MASSAGSPGLGFAFKGMGEGIAPADELGSEAIADHPSRLGPRQECCLKV